MRRILALVLALVVVIPVLAGSNPAAADPTASPSSSTGSPATGFRDVPDGHPFAADIEWMLDEQLATGYGDGTFRPAATITRQAAAAFLYRFAGAPEGQHPSCATTPFGDIPTDHAFCGEIAWLADQGYTTGYGDGTFRSTAPVTRQALAAQLYRLTGARSGDHPTCSTAPFVDIPTSHVFCGEVDWLVDNEIATGYTEGTFRPTNAVSRQAMAAFLHRLSNLDPEPDPDPDPDPDPKAAVDWRFDPAGILLAPGATGTVHLVGVDEDGNDTTAPLPDGVTFASTDPSAATLTVGADDEVTVTGAATAGMTLVTATIGEVTTDPITVTIAEPVDGAVLVPDDQIFFPRGADAAEDGISEAEVGPFTPDEVAARFVEGTGTDPEDPTSFLGDGTRLGYILRGSAPAPGTVLIGSGEVPLMGRVVSDGTTPTITRVFPGDGATYSLLSVEIVPFNEAFRTIKGGYDTDELEDLGLDTEAMINSGFCDPATNPDCDGTPTLVPGTPEVEPYDGPTAPGEGESDIAAFETTPFESDIAAFETTAFETAAVETGSDAPTPSTLSPAATPAADLGEFEVAGLECKAEGSVNVAALKLESLKPNIGPHVVLRVDIEDITEPYVRFELGARLRPEAVFSLNLQANMAGKVECTAGQGLKYVMPTTGPWGLIAPGARILPTVEANFEVTPGPSAKASVTARGNAWAVIGFEFDPANRYGHMAFGQHFRAIADRTGPEFTLTPEMQASLSDTDSMSLHAQVTAGIYTKLEFGVQLGGPIIEKYLRSIGKGNLADSFWQPFAFLKAGVQGRITYDNDGAVLTAKATGSFVGAEVVASIGIDSPKINDLVKALTNGLMTLSLELPFPGLPKWTLFEPPVMGSVVTMVDGDTRDAGSLEVTKGQTLRVEVPVDAAKTTSWTGELTGGSIWETVSATHNKSDVVDLTVTGGTKADKKLTGEVVVSDDLCDRWKSATTYSLLGYTPLGIDIPTWAGELTVTCIDPNIDWQPGKLENPGTAALKAKNLPAANRHWEITSQIPDWLVVSPTQGDFASADASAPVSLSLDDDEKPPDCGKPAKTYATTVTASAGTVDGNELTDSLEIDWKVEPEKPDGDECDPPPPGPGGPGGANGDPHMRTIDGLNYEGQVFGEYIYLQPHSGDPDDGPVVHVRHEATDAALVHGSRVTSATAAAVQLDGHVFEAYARPDLRFFVDSVEWTPTDATPTVIAPGLSVTKTVNGASIAGPQFNLEVSRSGGVGTNPSGFFDVTVMAMQDGSLHGLLGIPDSTTANDGTRADGVVETNLDDLAALRRFTDSYHLDDAEDSLLTGLPLAERPVGAEKYADPISDEELAPTLALVQEAINPPVCTTVGAGAHAYQQLTRNIALDAYAMAQPIGDLTRYSCSYYVTGTATLDLGPGQPLLPLTGLQVTIEAPGMLACTTSAHANGTYACDLKPANSTTAPPPDGIVATATARWPGDPTVVATGTHTFTELAPFNGSARGSIELSVAPDSVVLADISGTVTRDGVPYVGPVSIGATTDAPSGDPSAQFSSTVTTDATGTWTLSRALSRSVTSLDLTATIHEDGWAHTASTSTSGLHTGRNPVTFDVSYLRRTVAVTGTLTKDGAPLVGSFVVSIQSYPGSTPTGAPWSGTSVDVTADGSGQWSLSRTVPNESGSARITVFADGQSFVRDVLLSAGTNDVVFDIDTTRPTVAVSGTLHNEAGPYVGTPEVVVEAKRADGSTIQILSANAPTNSSGAYSASFALAQDAASAVIRIRIYENGWIEELTTTRTGLVTGLNPTTLDGSYSRVRYDVSGTATKYGNPLTGPANLVVQSSATPKGPFETGDLANSGNPVTLDANGHWSTTVYGPGGTTFVRLSLSVDDQWFTEDHTGVTATNTYVLDADGSQPIVTISGDVVKDGAPYNGPISVSIDAYKANPTPGGDPQYFWPATVSATVTNGQYSVTQVLPREAVEVRVRAYLDDQQRVLPGPVSVVATSTPNDIVFDLDLTQPLAHVSGTVTRNGGVYTKPVQLEVLGYVYTPGGTPEYFLTDSFSQTVTPDSEGYYQLSRLLPATTNRVWVNAYIDGELHPSSWKTVSPGTNGISFDVADDRPIVDVSGTLTNAGGELPDTVGITLFLYGGDPANPTYLSKAPHLQTTVSEDGTYSLSDIVLAPETTSIRASAWWDPSHGTSGFEQWFTVDNSHHTLVFDMSGSAKTLWVTGDVLLNGEPYDGLLTIRTVEFWDPDDCGFGEDKDPDCHHHGLGDTSADVEIVDGQYGYALELDRRTQKAWVWVDFVADGTFRELMIEPGSNEVTADLDLWAAPIHFEGKVQYDNGDPYTDPVTMWIYPEGDPEERPEDPTQVDGFQEFTFWMDEGDGAYSIDTFMPWDTGRVVFELHPHDLPISFGTGFDAPNDGVGYGWDWTLTRPTLQVTAGITVDGSQVEDGMYFWVRTNLDETRQYFIEPDENGEYRFFAEFDPGTWSLTVRAEYWPGGGEVCFPGPEQEVTLGFEQYTDWTYTGDTDIDTVTECVLLG